jgi:DNA-directed RNA polymerase subunit M/transcription elongation factor TFIIS
MNRYDSLPVAGFPQYNRLKLLAGIDKFLMPELIPDLLSILAEKNGEETLIKMIEEFEKNPNQPVQRLLFLHPDQKEYEYTKAVERDLIKNLPEVEESETMECSNVKCKSRKILARPVQARSGDEGVSFFTLCTECGRRERRNQ